MTRYADPHRCPDCRAELAGFPPSCPHCGISLAGPAAAELFATLQRADHLLGQLRAGPAPTPAMPSQTTAPAPTSATVPAASPAPAPPMYAAPAGPAPRTGLSGASVPKILLTLGALCLLVAAITFLAVAWSWLGVGGRTAVLIALTAAAGGLAWWLWRRGLRAAAESLSVVGFGMLTLDVIGAADAGWFGDLADGGLVVVIGSLVGLVGLVATYLCGRHGRALWAPQIFAGLGLWAVPAGALDLTSHEATVAGAATVGLGLVAWLAHVARIGRMTWFAGAAASFWWLVLAGIGLSRLTTHPTSAELWRDLHAWPMVSAALLLLVPAYLFRTHRLIPMIVSGVSAGLLTTTVAFPALDNSVNQAAMAALCAVTLWAVALLSVPRDWSSDWRLTPLIPMAVSALVVVPLGLVVGGQITDSLLGMGPAWSRDADVRLVRADTDGHPGLLVAMAVVGVLVVVALSGLRGDPRRFAQRFAPFGLAIALVAGVWSLAAYAVPLAVVVCLLLLIATLLATWAFRRTDADGSAALAGALALTLAALAAALPSTVLTLVVLTVSVVASAGLGLRGAGHTHRLAAGSVLTVAAAGLAWTVAELAGLHDAWKATPTLVVVGALALLLARLPVEIPAAVSGTVALFASVGAGYAHSESWGHKSLALQLTIAGAFVTASALAHPARRLLAYPGGLLLAMATWVRLYDLGVTAPEAYTLPSALVLVLLGLRRLMREPRSTTLATLAAGLTLATVPTLLRTFVDDAVSLRALLLGLACLALVMAGTRLRWTAPLVVGGAVGAVLVLRELGPYAADLPPWLVIAIAGTALTLVGITWESRLQNLRDAGRYVSNLR